MRKLRTKHPCIFALLLLAALFIALLADSAERLVTTDYVVCSSRLPESFDGFKIVQLSDIHGKSFGSGSRRLLRAVEAAKPDIIAITGDMCDERTNHEVIRTLLDGLTDIAPVYYVSGNHEWASGAVDYLAELFEEYGVVYLRNDYRVLTCSGEAIVIAGTEDPNSYADMTRPDELMERVSEEQPGLFRLLLNHRNDLLEKYPDIEADLALCGHAHGGIVRLPLLGGVLGGGFSLFPGYTAGEYMSGECEMIVSRGLGNSISIPRLFNNPEIVSVTLRPK